MNLPLCQTTSQIRGVATSLVLPSFANISTMTPSESRKERKGWISCLGREANLALQSLIKHCKRTRHNTVVALFFARHGLPGPFRLRDIRHPGPPVSHIL